MSSVRRRGSVAPDPGSITRSLDEASGSFNAMEGFLRRGRFTCYHGEEDKWPLHDEAALWNAEEIKESMEKFYAEAVRRLPLDEMPELVDCIGSGGHCIGLAHPVSNIILNAIHRLPMPSPSGVELPPQTSRNATVNSNLGWWFMVVASHFGLCTFLTEYFRYLTDIQARRYLHLASYDLSLAIKLVHHERFSPQSRRPLLPDGGKIKAALRIAAHRAGHPAPDDVAGLMTARYPSDLLSSIVANLQGDKLLSTGDVWTIRDMLARRWPPTPSVRLEFLCHPNGDTCIQGTSDNVLLHLSSCIGEDLLAKISIVNPHHKNSVPLGYISDLTFDSTYMTTKLSRCLTETTRRAGCNPGPTVDYDALKCEHIMSLKMCLVDAIHALYIKALAILPTSAGESRFLRALHVAGHCYGPMDPVSNIILNSIWYDNAFPPCVMSTQDHIEAQGGILDTRPMSRVESRSLNGLVAILRSTSKPPLSEHEALEYLYFWNCDLSRLCSEIPCSSIPFTAVAKSAKHPQHLAFGSFLMSLSSEKLTHLCSLLQAPTGGRISHAHWMQLTAIVHEESVCNAVDSARPYEAPCYLLHEASLEISRKKWAFRDRLTFFHTELKKVLHKYCNQHPWEPGYQLDIICGVQIGIPSRPTPAAALYMVTMLVSVTTALLVNVHPPSGSHSGNKDAGSIGVGAYKMLYDTATRTFGNSRFEGYLLESDYIYFDPYRDVELARVINGVTMTQMFAPPPAS
ncbi:hypothetical protein HU200_049542 [Digitaria exilis]|uniref:PIR2-like helical domain-containing protein n=1 Tax=Digitaria exilis TaxID=1010633 RepID=A0A835AUP7_9POAL|nr:hypothetical protein HU200_049542 [Digitaria exilis]